MVKMGITMASDTAFKGALAQQTQEEHTVVSRVGGEGKVWGGVDQIHVVNAKLDCEAG